MTALWILIGLIILQRLVELAIARRNKARLLARGGIEHGRRHYPLIVLLHVAWIAAMIGTIPPEAPMNIAWLTLFILLQGARLWVIASLGDYWTTRIISVPNEPLVRRGPYRFFNHPNYLVVALEIAALPMVFGAVEIAIGFSVLNAVIFGWRIQVENAALVGRT